MFETRGTSAAQTRLRGALSDVICSIAASAAEVTSNQAKRRERVNLVGAVRRWACGRCHGACGHPPTTTCRCTVRSLFLSCSLFTTVSPISLKITACRFYFYRAKKVAWSQRTAGSDVDRDRTCGLPLRTPFALQDCSPPPPPSPLGV